MKRLYLILILGVVVAVYLLWPREKEIPFEPVQTVKSATPTPAPMVHAALPKPKVPTPAPTVKVNDVLEHAATPSGSGADFHFDWYRKEYGPEAKEVEGRVTVTLAGYEGDFKVRFLISPKNHPQTVALVFEGITNPGGAIWGAGNWEEAMTDDGTLVIDYAGVPIRSLFSRKSGPDGEKEVLHDLTQISKIEFLVNPLKKKGSSEVKARFNFETRGKAEKIGTLQYELVPPPHPPDSH